MCSVMLSGIYSIIDYISYKTICISVLHYNVCVTLRTFLLCNYAFNIFIFNNIKNIFIVKSSEYLYFQFFCTSKVYWISFLFLLFSLLLSCRRFMISFCFIVDYHTVCGCLCDMFAINTRSHYCGQSD